MPWLLSPYFFYAFTLPELAPRGEGGGLKFGVGSGHFQNPKNLVTILDTYIVCGWYECAEGGVYPGGEPQPQVGGQVDDVRGQEGQHSAPHGCVTAPAVAAVAQQAAAADPDSQGPNIRQKASQKQPGPLKPSRKIRANSRQRKIYKKYSETYSATQNQLEKTSIS